MEQPLWQLTSSSTQETSETSLPSNAAVYRWMMPRLTKDTARKIAEAFNRVPNLPPSVTRINLGHVQLAGKKPEGSTGRRLLAEWLDILRSPPPWAIATPDSDNLVHWEGYVLGPSQTPYSGGAFEIEIVFPEDYPLHPMSVHFITRILHPNIAADGQVVVDLLNEQWSPVLTVSQILMHITSILIDPVEPFDCSSMSAETTDLFLNNREGFEARARDWTEKYAV